MSPVCEVEAANENVTRRPVPAPSRGRAEMVERDERTPDQIDAEFWRAIVERATD